MFVLTADAVYTSAMQNGKKKVVYCFSNPRAMQLFAQKYSGNEVNIFPVLRLTSK